MKPVMSPKKLLCAVALALASLSTLAACGSTTVSAATVNGREISQDTLEAELRAIEENEQYVASLEQPQDPSQGAIQVQGRGIGTLDADFVSRVLSRQILFELVRQEFRKRKLETSAEELREARRGVAEQVGGQAIFDEFSESYKNTLARRSAEVTELQALLERDGPGVEVACSRHILVDTKEQADALRAQIVAGTPFEQVAAANSKDTSNKDDGGDLQCQPAGTFVPAFEDAIENLQEGELSQPVQTEFGWHLIVVYDRREQPANPGAAFNQVLTEAAEKAEVSVNPRYGRWDKTRLPGAVVPPESPSTSTPPSSPPPGE